MINNSCSLSSTIATYFSGPSCNSESTFLSKNWPPNLVTLWLIDRASDYGRVDSLVRVWPWVQPNIMNMFRGGFLSTFCWSNSNTGSGSSCYILLGWKSNTAHKYKSGNFAISIRWSSRRTHLAAAICSLHTIELEVSWITPCP